jgi:hypothetical protein
MATNLKGVGLNPTIRGSLLNNSIDVGAKINENPKSFRCWKFQAEVPGNRK